LGSGWLAILADSQFLDFGFGLLQQSVTVVPQRLTPFVNRDALFKFNITPFQAPDDSFEFLQRPLETHIRDVGVFLVGYVTDHD